MAANEVTLNFSPEDYEEVYGDIEGITKKDRHYCAGCEHGIATRFIGLALDKLGLRERTIMCDSVGCSVLAYWYFNVDHIQCAHGRAPAVATGIKRMRPDLTVYTVQGDGDCLAIGLNETIWAALRAEPISLFLINNGIYGMTGGQMAPTTLQGMASTTTPRGRDIGLTGAPIDACKIMSQLQGAAYIRRVSLVIEEVETKRGKVWRANNLRKAKQVIENAFKVQEMGGFTFVECISTCSINWKLPVLESKRFANDRMLEQYPLGVYRDIFGIEGEVVLGGGGSGVTQKGRVSPEGDIIPWEDSR